MNYLLLTYKLFIYLSGVISLPALELRILIDTNILINLEDHKIIDDSFSSFYSLAKSNNCKIYIHPNSKNDIKNDTDKTRQEISLSKLNKYEVLPSPAKLTEEFSTLVGNSNNNNNLIDNSLLFQVYKGYVELLVTEDKGIHKKASKLNLQDKILDIAKALKFLKQEFFITTPKHPELRHLSVREISEYRTDIFFDSLKEDYRNFDTWLEKCAQDNRQCYALFLERKLSALLIYNIEIPVQHNLTGINHEALKMCTFKVAENALGHKMGELFLRKMIELCINKKINTLYLTVFEKQENLINLLYAYGFKATSTKTDGELILTKGLEKPSSSISNQREFYPFYTDNNVNKFIVPIIHTFYSKLFKDGNLRELSLFDESLQSFAEIVGKTIDKAYLCKSKTKGIKEGDILLFYSSKKHKVIEPIGILDSIIYSKDSEEIYRLVAKRTVYSEEDIKELVKDGKEITVLLFRLIVYLEKPISYKEIKDFESLKNNIITITRLSEEDYLTLKSKKKFDERYIIN